MYNSSSRESCKGKKKTGTKPAVSSKRRDILSLFCTLFAIWILLVSVFCCFVPSSSSQDSSLELYYDDGTAEAGYSPTLGLYTYAVRFYTPQQNETYELTEVSYYIYNKPSNFKMDIRDENITSVFSSIVTPSTTGWFSISLQKGITVRNEFYVAMKYLTLGEPELGADYDSPNNQSGESLYGFPTPPNVFSLDYMIRAKIRPTTVPTPSFTLKPESSTLLVYLAQSTRVNISIISFNGFNSSVELTAHGPPNVIASFSKPIIEPNEESTLTISTSYGTPRGVHSIIVYGSSNNMTVTQVFEITVVGDDPFKIVSPLSIFMYRGESVHAEIAIQVLDRKFDALVNLSIMQLPAGLTACFSKNVILPDENSTLSINASSSAALGGQLLVLRGTAQDFSDDLTVWLTVEVRPPPVWMQSWFWMLLGGFVGIIICSSAVQYYYKKWRKAKAPLDTDYMITASSLAELEELRLLNKISEKDYERLKKEYEQKLER